MKFYLDENLDPAIATGLRQRGIDAVTTQEAGLKGAGDDRQVAHALSTGRVLVTRDADFLRMHGRNVPHGGIVFVTGNRSIGEILRGLVVLHQVVPDGAMRGRVEYL